LARRARFDNCHLRGRTLTGCRNGNRNDLRQPKLAKKPKSVANSPAGLANPAVFLFRSARRALLGTNPMSRADVYRKNANECRQQAERSHNFLDKERWLKIAKTG
jgi:hypothetical protein